MNKQIVIVSKVKFTPKQVYCCGCRKYVMNIDGCPDCKTSIYLTESEVKE